MKLFKFSTVIICLFVLGTTGAFAQDFGFDDFAEEESASPALVWSGKGGLDIRGWIDTKNGYSSLNDIGDNTKMEYLPYLNLGINYSGSFSDFEAKTKFNKWSLGDYKWDMLDELTARLYAGNWVIEGGKMRLVWGKGDKLHILDNFNANDYTDFLIPDYIDRRISEPMLHIVYSAPTAASVRIEGVYTPMMTADRFASDGQWVPYSVSHLSDTVKSAVMHNANVDFASGDTVSALSALSFNSDSLYEDTASFKYGQAGLRITGTVGKVDLGASYYYGHYKQPSANMEKYALSAREIAILQSQASAGDENAGNALKTARYSYPSLDYDRLQVFGVEAATVLWKLNLRAEAAYNMTDDFSGDDPWVHNNSVAWLCGFDIDLPVSNLNFNIQETGTVVLKSGEIGGLFEEYDVDYDSDGHYTNNKIVINLSDSYLHEKLTAEISAVVGIENKEVLIMPKLNYNIRDGFNVVLRGAYLHSDDSDGEFYNFTAYKDGSSVKTKDKAFVQLAVRYDF